MLEVFRGEYLSGVIEAPDSIPSMTNRVQRKKKASGRKHEPIEEVGLEGTEQQALHRIRGC